MIHKPLLSINASISKESELADAITSH